MVTGADWEIKKTLHIELPLIVIAFPFVSIVAMDAPEIFDPIGGKGLIKTMGPMAPTPVAKIILLLLAVTLALNNA